MVPCDRCGTRATHVWLKAGKALYFYSTCTDTFRRGLLLRGWIRTPLKERQSA